MTIWSLDPFSCCITSIAALLTWMLWKYKWENVDNSPVDEQSPPRVVIDHGKALFQMVKFRIRFKQKLRRIRERKQIHAFSQENSETLGNSSSQS